MKSRLIVALTMILCVEFLLPFEAKTQASLQPGFDRNEYADMLWLQFNGFNDSLANQQQFTLSKGRHQRVMISPEVGLYNKCAVYLREDGVVVIQLRGTVNKPESWLENFYAGMVPAIGELQLSTNYKFAYKMAENKEATVHIGWLIGTGFLVKTFLPSLDSLVAKGHTNIIVSGHSQGGALSFLTTSFLHYYFLQQQKNVVLKTYASAAPKPGNLYYAYDFDFITRNQMGFRIVNAADWVPETPFSLQTIQDYNEVNPLADAKGIIKKQKFLIRTYMNSIYKKLDGSSSKASRKFEKYLGEKLFKLVEKPLPGYVKPTLAGTMNYSTAGTPIVLLADTAYLNKFTFDGKNYFVHHMLDPYMYLLNQHYPISK
jgi:Lipase (class 3)